MAQNDIGIINMIADMAKNSLKEFSESQKALIAAKVIKGHEAKYHERIRWIQTTETQLSKLEKIAKLDEFYMSDLVMKKKIK